MSNPNFNAEIENRAFMKPYENFIGDLGIPLESKVKNNQRCYFIFAVYVHISNDG